LLKTGYDGRNLLQSDAKVEQEAALISEHILFESKISPGGERLEMI